MNRRLLPVLVLCLLAAGADKDDANKKDLEKMQGDWAALSMVVNGEKLPDDEAQSLFRTIKDNNYTVSQFKKAIGKGIFKLDASKKPRTIDATPVVAGQEVKPMLGIYELDGDKLKLCFARPGQPRPTGFSAKEDSGHTLTVWEREKK